MPRYTLTSVWRKTSGERRISTSTRTLEEFVEPFVNLAKGWNLQRVSAPSPVTRESVEEYARYAHSHLAPEFNCTLESLTLEPTGE